MYRVFQRVLRTNPLPVVAATLLALGCCASASAQTIPCPVTSNFTATADILPQSVCVVDSGVTLTIASAGFLENWYTISALPGTIINDGTITNSGALVSEPGSTVTNFGTILNNVGASFDGGALTNAGILDNFGDLGTSANVILSNAGNFLNEGGLRVSTVTNTVGATINNVGHVSVDVSFTNNGIVENFSSSTFSSTSAGVTLTNNATLRIDSGASFTSAGTLVNNPGATLADNGTLTSEIQFENDGALAVGSSTSSGILVNLGGLTNNGSITNLAPSAAAAFPGITNSGLLTNNSTITNGGTAGFAVMTNNGTFRNVGTLTLQLGEFDNNLLMVNSGTVTNHATFNNTSLVANASGALFNNQVILENDGTFDNSGTFLNTGEVHVATGAVFNNLPGATYMQSGATASGVTWIDGTLNTASTFQVSTGKLFGNGTVNGNVSNSSGTMLGGFPGTLTVNGDYSQGSAGLMAVELFGTGAGQFDALDVSGLVTLDGTLDIFSSSIFTPSAGDDFTFLLFGSLSGDFAGINIFPSACPTGDTCTIVTTAHSMSFDVAGPNGGGGTTTPEPGTLALFGSGLLALALCARRKLQRYGSAS